VTSLLGLPIDAAAASSWVLAIGTTVAGAFSFEWMRRIFKERWDAAQEAIEEIELRERAG
jgi:hypothetical protein